MRRLLPATILALSAVLAFGQSFQWTKRAGSWAYDLGHAIGSDSYGNVYIAGKYEMNANFGGISVTCAGNHDMYVAKYGPSGNILWVKTAGGPTGDYAHALAVDNTGNVYVTGEFEGTASFGSGVSLTSNGDNDIFIAKYNTSGVLQWAKKLGGGSLSDKARGITVHGSAVYITGKFEGTGNFAGTTLGSSGGKEIFVAKYSTAGVFQWVKKAGGPGSDEGYAISNDAAGNVYVTGWFSGTAGFSGMYVSSKGAKDIFVAKYNSSGTVQWVKKFGGSYDDFGKGIKVDNSGNIYIGGGFRYKCAFGTTTLTSSGKSDVFVAKLSSSGSALWAKKGGGSLDDEANALALDNSANVFLTGRYGNTATFGTSSLSGADSNEVFFVSYGPSGSFRWALRGSGSAEPSAPGKDPEMGLSIATDPSGNVLASGTYRGNSSFGTTTLGAWANTDIFITKIAQSSTFQSRVASPRLTPADSASYCVGGYVELQTESDSLSSYAWLRNGHLLEGQQGNTIQAKAPGVYQALVIMGNDTVRTNETLVRETKQLNIAVNLPSGGFCKDSNAVLSASRGDGYTYQWKRNGWNIRSANAYTYQPTRNGRYQVKIVQGSCIDLSPSVDVDLQTCADTAALEVTGLPGALADDSLMAVKIYPNPNSGLFTLELNLSTSGQENGEIRLQVINSVGQLYFEKLIANPGPYVTEEISLDSSARTGVYFLKITAGHKVETSKILLLRP